jgi:LacI family transcriptional regulator
LAAEHFLERGFTRFAFFGCVKYDWSRRRQDGFARRVEAAGWRCEEYRLKRDLPWGHPSWDSEITRLSRWITGLPKPLGLMACNDFFGVQIIDVCRRADVAVPEEVAVIGVDNETLACEMANPPLSSVIPDCRRIGYEAAQMLDRLIKGDRPSASRRSIAPRGIAIRQSTDVTAIDDPLVAEAMRFIREHACDGIQIADILEHVTTSRSVLQRRFRKVLRRTIHDTIAGIKLQRVKQLLIETDLSLADAARRAGYVHVEYLSAAFRQATGSSPGAYRKEHRRQ